MGLKHPHDVHSAAELNQIIQSMDRWLLSDEVCALNGAVAGKIRHGQVLYWYPEIAGYYLSYLAYLKAESAADTARLNQLSLRVSKWLCQVWLQSGQPTRIHAQAQEDWRNAWHFSFDQAMVLRGLADAESQSLSLAWSGGELAENMHRFNCKVTGIKAVISASNPNTSRPHSWSTTGGAFQWKTLSGLLRYAQVFEHTELKDWVDGWQVALRRMAYDLGSLPPHPALYAIEGWVDCQQMRGQNKDMIWSLLPWHHRLQQNACKRNDVWAQQLRVWCHQPDQKSHSQIALVPLTQAVSPEGFLPFSAAEENTANIWCTLFSRQALADFIQPQQSFRTDISQWI